MRADVIPEGGTTNVLERFAVCLGDPPRNRGCNFATLRGNVEMSTEAKIAIDLALLLLICVLIWMRWHGE